MIRTSSLELLEADYKTNKCWISCTNPIPLFFRLIKLVPSSKSYGVGCTVHSLWHSLE